MGRYMFLEKKTLEKMDTFEKRVNETASAGWRIVNFTETHRGITVLFERER